MNQNRPKVTFPDSFEIGISTNDFGLNITEIAYFDKDSKKLRIQLFYSVLGLEPNKGVDVVMDEINQKIVLQSENDCKKTSFHESLLPF
jgi:hypothetical protein